MTRLYGYHQAETVAYRAIRAQCGWLDVAQYRQWEWPHALLASDVSAEHEVLSIGAHGCGVTAELSWHVQHMTAVDPHSQLPAWAQEELRPGSTVGHLDARDLPYEDESFDRVVCVSTLEHVRPPEDGDIHVAREIGRVLRPGGRAVITLEVAQEWTHWQLPVGRLYDLERIMSRVVEPSGLQLLNPEGLDWDAGDWGHIWPDIHRQKMPDLIPAALVLSKGTD